MKTRMWYLNFALTIYCTNRISLMILQEFLFDRERDQPTFHRHTYDFILRSSRARQCDTIYRGVVSSQRQIERD